MLSMWALAFCFSQEREGVVMEIQALLDGWHHAAAVADEVGYFGVMDDRAVFLGTDATERWTKSEFQVWAKPHFQKASAWTLKPVRRAIELSESGQVAWFDEDLDTSMGPCRGSGVLENTHSGWKIVQYNLAMTIPNDAVSEVKTIVARVLDGN